MRIDETAFMQSRQFAQDAGPMAHPIRPDEYEAIDNFYTVTVYEKGAEVIRMLHTLLGAEAYRKGTDLYFARHDGTAATCDDFVAAMEEASGTISRNSNAGTARPARRSCRCATNTMLRNPVTFCTSRKQCHRRPASWTSNRW
jgi:hypothetical protein